MFKKLLYSLSLTLGLFLIPAAAHAACAPIPYVFVPGVSQLTSGTTNTNNATLRSCSVNVDNTQVGVAGFFASQIIPTSSGQATFGGTQPYTFPSNIIINGNINGTGTLTIPTISSTNITGTGTLSIPTISSTTISNTGVISSAGLTTDIAPTPSGQITIYSPGCSSTSIFSSTGTTGGIQAQGFGLFCNGSSTSLLAVDGSGNLGIAGSYNGATGNLTTVNSTTTNTTNANVFNQLTGAFITATSSVTTPLMTDTGLSVLQCVGTNASFQLSSSGERCPSTYLNASRAGGLHVETSTGGNVAGGSSSTFTFGNTYNVTPTCYVTTIAATLPVFSITNETTGSVTVRNGSGSTSGFQVLCVGF